MSGRDTHLVFGLETCNNYYYFCYHCYYYAHEGKRKVAEEGWDSCTETEASRGETARYMRRYSAPHGPHMGPTWHSQRGSEGDTSRKDRVATWAPHAGASC
jgi:hypothetical protein